MNSGLCPTISSLTHKIFTFGPKIGLLRANKIVPYKDKNSSTSCGFGVSVSPV